MTRILLAEDDLFLRDIYTEILGDESFQVTSAVDGVQALQLIKQGNWDLVLLDVVMPKMTGIDVLKNMRDCDYHRYAKHIVIMTNSDESKETQEVKDMIDGYLIKSAFAPDELIQKIRQFLN